MRRRVPVLAIVSLLSGCSFLVVRPTSHATPGESVPSCKGYGWPAADLLGLPLAGVLRIDALIQDCEGSDANSGCDARERRLNYMAVGTLVVFAASAIYGFAASSACRRQLD